MNNEKYGAEYRRLINTRSKLKGPCEHGDTQRKPNGECIPCGWARLDALEDAYENMDPGYIYATLLPNGTFKVGKASRLGRAFGAQTYFAEPCIIAAVWQVGDMTESEELAHTACEDWRLRSEVFANVGHWLDLQFPLVATITDALGEAPMTDIRTQQKKRQPPAFYKSKREGYKSEYCRKRLESLE